MQIFEKVVVLAKASKLPSTTEDLPHNSKWTVVASL